ncbi:PREDICTED: A disintegrin and metalloproteinase with thrombospondin motifs 20-like [Priapulus caudatus]|uniref:A disintegrin and metalloproteinase with thrombospondin motifs 20-like n=1 Tax=Priapulus caudatus TaxID=37621 RepID=A0ABM1EIH0_PRICU|nr:PREDICTED: A disintegrin and metalloproteinase with thrombospondin motifs 20-like [Priapulus caudatus]
MSSWETESNKTAELIEDKHCAGLDKPHETIDCKGPCYNIHWQYTDWSQCSVSCGGGERYRSAICVDGEGQTTADSYCNRKELPLTVERCNQGVCPVWVLGDWESCSVTCGAGHQRRAVWCQGGDGQRMYPASCANATSEQTTSRRCELTACPDWDTGAWGQCSVSCGSGTEMRAVRCRSATGDMVQEAACSAPTRPPAQRECSRDDCVTPPPPLPVASPLVQDLPPPLRDNDDDRPAIWGRTHDNRSQLPAAGGQQGAPRYPQDERVSSELDEPAIPDGGTHFTDQSGHETVYPHRPWVPHARIAMTTTTVAPPLDDDGGDDTGGSKFMWRTGAWTPVFRRLCGSGCRGVSPVLCEHERQEAQPSLRQPHSRPTPTAATAGARPDWRSRIGDQYVHPAFTIVPMS